MTVKLAVLKSGENIISNFKEGHLDEKLVCYLLEHPCLVTINGKYKVLDEEDSENKVSVSLSPWPSFSKQTSIELVPEWVVTLVEPNDEIKQMYETKVLGITKNENDKDIVFTEQSNSDQSN